MNLPEKTTGLKRIGKALFYSFSGFKSAFKTEAAFRQELVLFLILLFCLIYIPFNTDTKMILLMANTLVLITELLNSAIETVVDLASPKYHQLAKNAKDIASGAVLVSLILSLILWVMAIWQIA